MYLHGSFLNKKSEVVTVCILSHSDKSQALEIGNEDDGVLFTDNPVEIKSEVNDTLDHLLCSSATINLQVKNYMAGLFCNTCRDAVVNIYRGDICVFAGYLEPQTYSQPYNEIYDELSLNCVDCLSALQYSNYKNIGSLGVSYSVVKGKATQRTFLSLLAEIMNDVTEAVDILGNSPVSVFYDGSRLLSDKSEVDSVFSGVSVNELLFLGDEEDDVWTMQDVLTEIMKYLNLHILQDGTDFYVFSWETLRNGGSKQWYDLSTGATISTKGVVKTVTSSMVADCDCQFSIADVYNQVMLTDSVTEMENLVENPMDSSSLVAAFGNYQKYMTEYIAEGEGVKANKAFGAMVTGGSTDWEGASMVDWYLWVKNNPLWKFYYTDNWGTTYNVYDKYCQDGQNQQAVLTEGLNKGIGAAIVAFGCEEKKNGGQDNSPASAPDMKDYLVVGLSTTLNTTAYVSEDFLEKASPIAEYVGNTAGGTFSPNDDETTNYIQISGKIILNPLMEETESYSAVKACTAWGDGTKYWHKTVPSRNNSDGRYYTQRFYKAASWKDDVVDDEACNNRPYTRGVFPFTDNGPQEYEFDYNAAHESKDTVSKVGVLQCMLVIGDKCVVESLPDNGGSGNGEPSDFSWQTFKERSECADADEYFAQSFAIGFDPKLHDKLIGKEFDIQKNAPYTIGVTVEGTMIPIKKSDKVHGQVRFYILGPVNEEWNNVTKRHKTWFRHTKYYDNSVYLLEHTSSIMVRDFEIKVKSNNGKLGAVGDEKDIIYMSDTKESSFNKKDDLEFKFTTALTSEECNKMGVNNSVKLSSPQNEESGDALMSIYDKDTATTAKPEQLYVDACWREWHEPRVVMTQNFEDADISFLDLFHVPAIGKAFHVQGISRNLVEATALAVMKEVF